MIRLTDEEIRQELAKLPDTNLFLSSAYEESSIRWNEFIAKAQLKKVHEWGEEQCQGHHTSGIWFKRRECTKCWQTLLNEVKDV